MVQLRLPGYEGPLDLLLELIERNELDINELSLVQVADQYLQQLQRIEARAAGAADSLPEALAEFIVIGSKLMLLKSRALLPREPDPAAPPEEDVGHELVEMLEEYRRYRDAVAMLGAIDRSGLRSFGPSAPPPVETPPPTGLPEDVTLDLLTDLVRQAFARADQRAKQLPQVELQRDPITVQDTIADLEDRLRRFRRVSFRAWISEARTRVAVIVTFLAILELYKSRRIELRQDGAYADIVIEARRGAGPSPAEATAEAAAVRPLEAEPGAGA